MDVALLKGLGVVLAAVHGVGMALPVPLAVAVGVSVGVALPVPQAVADKVRLEVKMGLLLPVAATRGDTVPKSALRVLLGVREGSGEVDAEEVTLGLELVTREGEEDEEKEHPSARPR